MAADNFDLQGWMREQRQGPYTGPKGAEKVALKSSKPKSKTGLNEGLMGMIDLQPINGIMREEMEDDSTNTIDDLQLHLYNIQNVDDFEKVEFIYNNILDESQQAAVDQMKNSGEDDYDILSYLINNVIDEGDLKQVIDHFSDMDYSMNEDSVMDEGVGEDISSKWELIPMEEKEGILDSVDFSEEGLADYAYMGWKMIPEEVRELITDKVMAAKVTEPEPDEDEKIAAMAMKQAKKGAKAVKGLNPDKDIYDLLHGDEDGDLY